MAGETLVGAKGRRARGVRAGASRGARGGGEDGGGVEIVGDLRRRRLHRRLVGGVIHLLRAGSELSGLLGSLLRSLHHRVGVDRRRGLEILQRSLHGERYGAVEILEVFLQHRLGKLGATLERGGVGSPHGANGSLHPRELILRRAGEDLRESCLGVSHRGSRGSLRDTGCGVQVDPSPARFPLTFFLSGKLPRLPSLPFLAILLLLLLQRGDGGLPHRLARKQPEVGALSLPGHRVLQSAEQRLPPLVVDCHQRDHPSRDLGLGLWLHGVPFSSGIHHGVGYPRASGCCGRGKWIGTRERWFVPPVQVLHL